MLGGLYGDLPPPSSTSEDDKAPSNSNVWSSSAKMAPPTLRKPFFPRPQPRPKPQPTIQPTQGPSPSSFHPSLAGPTSNVVEEYDPARPNDYEEYLRERRQRQADADRRREAEERARKEREREREERERDLNISGEEAWRRRAAMSGGGGAGGGDFSIGKSESGGMGVGAEGKMTTAERMMAKMGWKAGKGLGREEQGMTKALSVRKTDKRAGAIVNESEAAKQQQQQQQGGVEKKVKSVQFNMAPTRVVLLRNMVCLRLILGCR